jgi:outer membrane protein TolC
MREWRTLNLDDGRWSINLSATILTVVALVSTAQADTLTLNQALALAYETNPQLDAERAALRATDEGVATAVSGWRPTVSAGASYGYSRDRTAPPDFPVVAPNGHPRDASVALTQPIFNGATIPQTHEAKAEVEAGRAQLSSIEQTTLLAAAKNLFRCTGRRSRA